MKAESCNKIFVTVINDYHINDHVDSPINNPYEENQIQHLLYKKCWIRHCTVALEDLIKSPVLVL